MLYMFLKYGLEPEDINRFRSHTEKLISFGRLYKAGKENLKFKTS